MNTYKYKSQWGGKTHNVVLAALNYENNGTLAVEMVVVKKGKPVESYGVITVNIDDIGATDTMAFVDTNNMGRDIVEWLEENGIAKRTGFYGMSGYCTYPLMQFDLRKLQTDL